MNRATKSGAEGRNRTADTGIFSPLLYRLSYLGAPQATPSKPQSVMAVSAMRQKKWRPQRESNPRCRRERAVSWATRRWGRSNLKESAKSFPRPLSSFLVSREGFEPSTHCLKGSCSNQAELPAQKSCLVTIKVKDRKYPLVKTVSRKNAGHNYSPH